jgi:cell division protein FtsB
MPDKTASRRKVDTGALTPVVRGRRIAHWLLFFVAFVVVVDSLVGDKGLLATLRARREYNELAGVIARARQENARLREEARQLLEDPGAIEAIARRELGLIRPGERLFIIKDVASPPPADPSITKP